MTYVNALLAGVFGVGLSLAFAQTPAPGPAPAPTAPVQRPLDPKLPTVFVLGDSTASNGDRLGWGDPFADYFDLTKINVANRARGGRSSRTFFTEGLWDKALAEMKAGDYAIIQFGHNDGGPIDAAPFRGSVSGLSEETREITTRTGDKEVVHTFGWYMRKYIADARAKGVTPILLSLTVRNIWTDGKVERGCGNFSQWAAEIAKAQGVTFLDLTNIIAGVYEKMGQENVKEFFPKDHTHTSQAGADLNASLVVAGLKGLRSTPLVTYLSAKGQAIQPIASPAAATPQGPPSGTPRAAGGPMMQMPTPADPKLPTLWLIGDSTVRNGRGDGSNGQWGWGEPLVDFFDKTKINVVNRAVGGLSSRTFLTQGHWDRVLAMIKPGDLVMMQFGHNDNGPVNDNFRARGTIKGTGEETEEIDNLLTKQHEIVHSFGWYLRKFIADSRARGATPLVCSLIPRGNWVDGKLARNSQDFGKWAADVAMSEKTPFVDLNEIIARQCDALGPERVVPLFASDRLHTTRAGAEMNAASVVAGLKGNTPNPLVRYFSEKTKDIAPYPLARAQASHQGPLGPLAPPPDPLESFKLPLDPQLDPARPGVQPPAAPPSKPPAQVFRTGVLLPTYNPALPTVFLIGDSTVKNSWDTGSDGLWGWGRPLAAYFDKTKINVENQALGGTSSRSYITGGHWGRVSALVRPGDFVIMQFGHNDGGMGGSLKGNGEETQEVAGRGGQMESLHSYGWYIRKYIADTKAKGATPIVCSLIPRNDWADGTARCSMRSVSLGGSKG